MHIKRHDGSQRPNAQEAANAVLAIATLDHEPADKGFIDAVCNHFVRLIKQHDDSKRPNAQEAAHVVWAVATLGHEPADRGLVDAVCKHFAMLSKHHDVFQRPSAQGAANAMWALGKMKHAPPASVATDISEHFMVLWFAKTSTKCTRTEQHLTCLRYAPSGGHRTCQACLG